MIRLLALALFLSTLTAGAAPLIQPDDTVALAGGANIERTRFYPWLQTQLVAAFPDGTLKVRNFGWEGDTVFEQWRDGGDVEKLDEKRRAAEKRMQEQTGSTSWRQQRDWDQQLTDAGVTLVLAQFGQMESLAGPAGLPAFAAAYEKLIAEFARGGRRVVLLEPVPFEATDLPDGPDLPSHNPQLAAYTTAIRELAAKLDLPFLPLTEVGENRPALTGNGFHLDEEGHRFAARRFVEGLGLAAAPEDSLAAAHREMIELERLWFDTWRPMNWSFLMGDRTHVPYSRDWKDQEKRLFPEEMKEFLPLLDQAEGNVRAALSGKPVTPIVATSSIPVEPPSAKPQSPEEELASFQIMDGFAVNLFASEADGIVKPIQMRWDERGRLWVACALSYPQIKPGEKANDYVLVCEDTDHDGKADKFDKFVEGLFMPSGIELGDGGLYVAQGTELLHFKDTDGDGRADSRRLVLGGFGTADSHQMINCINWGFGGELWFSQGHHIYSRVETPYGVETLNRAGIWRYRPRTGHLDPFFQWSSAGANCWGVVTTRDGQPFHKSGANIGSYYSTPGLVRSNLAVDARALNLCLAPIKQVGMEFLESSHFPDEMQGRVLIGGYYGNTLEQHRLDYDEKTGLYSTELLPNLIETKNNVFRPIEVRMGPDGALYVTDWYNPIIGHYQASYRHPDRDKEHGRIWRVTAKGRPLVQPSSLAEATLFDLLEKLDSKERWELYQVKRLLFDRPTVEVVSALDGWVPSLKAGDETDEYRRLQALSIYEAHETPRPELLKELLRSSDAKVRAYATRALSTWARNGHPEEELAQLEIQGVLALLETQVADEDPLVRLEAIVACSYVDDPRAALVAARALDRDFNDYHRHALTKTLHVTHHLWAPLLSQGGFSFDRDEHLLFALQNSWVENNPADLANLSGGAVDYHPNAASGDVRAVIRRQVDRFKDDPARELVWLRALAKSATAADLPLFLGRGVAHPELLAAISVLPESDPAPLLEPLWASADPAVKKEAVRLSGLWKAGAFADRVRELAFDPASDLRGPAFEALLVLDPDAAVARKLAQLQKVADPAAAAPILNTLLAKADGRAGLARALAKPDALSPAAAKHVLNALNQIGRAEPKLSAPLMKLAGLNEALPVYTKEVVAKVVKDARTFGNAEEGKKVYETAGCIACHIPGAAQSKIGPDLSAISRGLPPELIVTELVWPALNVKEGYEAATVTLKDGTVVTGFKQTDTAEAIAVRDLATGAVRSIPKSETKDIQMGGTVMPDGLTAGMDETQLAHLVRYLMGLGAE
ncbi:MAG: HEAT repeat domain-containing protein [Verrucomicrobiae bacterium]|nr:HEAT repeat domain-containing protein [Verrucomicrobiae bacterium]